MSGQNTFVLQSSREDVALLEFHNFSDLQFSLAERKWRVRQTIMEMIEDRGFTVHKSMLEDDVKNMQRYTDETKDAANAFLLKSALAPRDMTFDTFKRCSEAQQYSAVKFSAFRIQKMSDQANMSDQADGKYEDDVQDKPKTDHLMTIFRPKLDRKYVVSICNKMQADGVHTLILVTNQVKGNANNWVTRHVKSMNTSMIIDVFCAEELICNVMRYHRDAPKQVRLLNDDEIKALLVKHYLPSVNHLPQLWASRAMARYYGARPGQVMYMETNRAHKGPLDHWRVITDCEPKKLRPNVKRVLKSKKRDDDDDAKEDAGVAMDDEDGANAAGADGDPLESVGTLFE